VRRIVVEAGKQRDSQEQFLSPCRNSSRKKRKTDLDDFEKCVTRSEVNDFPLSEKQRPILKGIMRIFKDKINFSRYV
jgi:hypothetical protein